MFIGFFHVFSMIWDGYFVVGLLDFPVGFIWHLLDTFDRRAMNNGIGFHGILKSDWPPLEKLHFGVPCWLSIVGAALTVDTVGNINRLMVFNVR